MSSKNFTVPNISCDHCSHTIKMELADLAGVQSVQADTASKQVTVEWSDPASWGKDRSAAAGNRLPAGGVRRVGHGLTGFNTDFFFVEESVPNPWQKNLWMNHE